MKTALVCQSVAAFSPGAVYGDEEWEDVDAAVYHEWIARISLNIFRHELDKSTVQQNTLNNPLHLLWTSPTSKPSEGKLPLGNPRGWRVALG